MYSGRFSKWCGETCVFLRDDLVLLIKIVYKIKKEKVKDIDIRYFLKLYIRFNIIVKY